MISVESNRASCLDRTAAAFCGAVATMLALSNLVSNVPAVMLFRPLVGSLSHRPFVWLARASASTLAGNSTPFSSVANLIVLRQANKKTTITFWEFTRVGLVVTLITTAAAIGLLALESQLFPSASLVSHFPEN